MITRDCEHCGGEFQVHPSRVKHGRGKHCSPKCQYEARRNAPKNLVEFVCVGCGASFNRNPSWLTRKGAGKFCNRLCRDQHWKGDITPNWQSGNGVYKRGPHWYSTRRRILKRDGNACTVCGSTEKPHVHHKIPFRMFDNPDDANTDDNLITLCPVHHRREDAKWKWLKFDNGILNLTSGGYAWQLFKEGAL